MRHILYNLNIQREWLSNNLIYEAYAIQALKMLMIFNNMIKKLRLLRKAE